MLRIALLAAVLGGCDLGTVGGSGTSTDGGGSGDGSGTNAAAKMAFDMNVAPAVTAQGCTDAAKGVCHGQGQNPKLTSYEDLMASEALYGAAGRYLMKPGSGSILVTKGVHQTQATFWDTTQKAAITAFIDGL